MPAGAAAQALAAGLPIAAADSNGRGRWVPVEPRRPAAISAPRWPLQYATIGANTQLAGGDVTTQATNLAVHEYAKTAGYFTEFPENIHLIGASFNTQLQSSWHRAPGRGRLSEESAAAV